METQMLDDESTPTCDCGEPADAIERLTNGYIHWDYAGFTPGQNPVCAPCLDICRLIGEVEEYSTATLARDLLGVAIVGVEIRTAGVQ